MLNWIGNMAGYVKELDTHDRPVTSSSYSHHETAEAISNSMYNSSNLDYVDWHYYPDQWSTETINGAVSEIRRAEFLFNKGVFMGEFWPWTGLEDVLTINADDAFMESSFKAPSTEPTESAPYRGSLGRMWTQLVSSGISGAQRWMSPSNMTGMTTLNVDSLYSKQIPFISSFNWNNWNLASSKAWEHLISGSAGTTFKAGRGDGDQVMAIIQSSANDFNYQVSGIDNGYYQLRVFDFITGKLVNEFDNISVTRNQLNKQLNFANSVLDLNSDNYDRRRVAIISIEKKSEISTTTVDSTTINWGKTTVGSSSTTANYSLAMGGTTPSANEMLVKSISIYLGAQTGDVRLGLYVGGSLNKPEDGMLLWDAGTVNSNGVAGWYTVTAPETGFSLPSSLPIWLGFKRNNGVRIYYSASSSEAGDFQTERGRNLNTFNQTPSVSYPKLYNENGTFGTSYYSVYITYGIP